MKKIRGLMSVALLLVMIFTIAGCGLENSPGGGNLVSS